VLQAVRSVPGESVNATVRLTPSSSCVKQEGADPAESRMRLPDYYGAITS
jgi:hypothetical protein